MGAVVVTGAAAAYCVGSALQSVAPTFDVATGRWIMTAALVVGGVAVIAACASGTAATGGVLAFVCAPLTVQTGAAIAATVVLTMNVGTANACPANPTLDAQVTCEPLPEPDCSATTDNASCVACARSWEAAHCEPTVDGSLWSAPFYDGDHGYCNVGWAGCDLKR